MKRAILFLLVAFALFSCRKGEKIGNLTPDTRISVSSINLTGEDRLRSEVQLNWLGYDEDGYILGYELSMDGTTWEFTEVTDSLFQFSLEAGQDTTDIEFYVRSIDDQNDVDPSPAYLRIPIRNSAPTAVFDTVNVIPDTSFIVTTFFIDVNDQDGQENLDSIFLKVNNGAWYSLPPSVRTVTLVPADPTNVGPVGSIVYTGAEASQLNAQIQGLNIEQDNILYLRASDIAGSESEVDTSEVFYVKQQTSDLLVVDAHAGGSATPPESILFPSLNRAYPAGFDRIDLRVNGGVNRPILWSPTFSFFLSFYDKVYWYADESLDGFSVLENAAGSVQSYLNEGGKMFINTGFPTGYQNTSVIHEFTPVDSISTSGGLARIPTNRAISPAGPDSSNYDTLRCSVFMGRSAPIYHKSTSEPMFRADILATGGWVGPDVVCARSINANGNANVVFMSVELHKLNNDSTAVETLYDQVFNNEFNW